MTLLRNTILKNKNPDLYAIQLVEKLQNDLPGMITDAVAKALEGSKEFPINRAVNAVVETASKKLLENFDIAQGDEGEPGEKGEKGDTGEVGPRGEKGDTGEQGEMGIQGMKGERGNDGTNGTNGTNGEMGPAGKDGSPDKPQEIATKLNTLTEVLDIKVIKGLAKALSGSRGGTPAKGGGGIGNLQHESFVVTSATTTISLAYKIGQNGYAIVDALYNDGGIVRGTHYTVGVDRRTITLLFTPDDPTPGQNNTVNLIYIRS